MSQTEMINWILQRLLEDHLGVGWVVDVGNFYTNQQHAFDVTGIFTAINNGTLMGVSDGSYERSHNQFLCVAGRALVDMDM